MAGKLTDADIAALVRASTLSCPCCESGLTIQATMEVFSNDEKLLYKKLRQDGRIWLASVEDAEHTGRALRDRGRIGEKSNLAELKRLGLRQAPTPPPEGSD